MATETLDLVTPAVQDTRYIPDTEDAASEAAARLRVARHLLAGMTQGDFEECDGYEVSVIEEIIDSLIETLDASVREAERRRTE
jgi:hypothetical protein